MNEWSEQWNHIDLPKEDWDLDNKRYAQGGKYRRYSNGGNYSDYVNSLLGISQNQQNINNLYNPIYTNPIIPTKIDYTSFPVANALLQQNIIANPIVRNFGLQTDPWGFFPQTSFSVPGAGPFYKNPITGQTITGLERQNIIQQDALTHPTNFMPGSEKYKELPFWDPVGGGTSKWRQYLGQLGTDLTHLPKTFFTLKGPQEIDYAKNLFQPDVYGRSVLDINNPDSPYNWYRSASGEELTGPWDARLRSGGEGLAWGLGGIGVNKAVNLGIQGIKKYAPQVIPSIMSKFGYNPYQWTTPEGAIVKSGYSKAGTILPSETNPFGHLISKPQPIPKKSFTNIDYEALGFPTHGLTIKSLIPKNLPSNKYLQINNSGEIPLKNLKKFIDGKMQNPPSKHERSLLLQAYNNLHHGKDENQMVNFNAFVTESQNLIQPFDKKYYGIDKEIHTNYPSNVWGPYSPYGVAVSYTHLTLPTNREV